MLSLVDSTQLLRIFMWAFAAFTLPLLLLFGFVGIVYSFALSIIISPLIMFITVKLGRAGGRLYSGSASPKSEHELLLLELEKIKILHGRREYDQALSKVNIFNREHPDIPEALYLKAHILWDGFREKAKAMSCLRKVMSCSEPGSDYFKWAHNFREELRAFDDEGKKKNSRSGIDG